MNYNKDMNFKLFQNSGVYTITNILTCQKYVGSSSALKKRFSYHRITLANNKHPNPKLQNSYNKYGKDVFSYEILLNCDRDNALHLEQGYIDTGEFYFNISKIARRPEPIIRSVCQYSIEGIFLKTFKSLADAAREVGLPASPQGIFHCCKGSAKTCAGFRWRYLEPDLEQDIGALPPTIPQRGVFRYIKNYVIHKYTKSMDYLSSYSDIEVLSLEIDSAIPDIRKYLHGKAGKTLKGFIFKLESINE